MALSVTHARVVTTPDSGNGKVSTTAWNDAHVLTGTANMLVGFDGTGAGAEIDPASLGGAGGIAPVADRTALAAHATTVPVYLKESGREGIFVWSSADNSTYVTADTQQGIYVAPASATTGASGAWVRKYTGPANALWFGLVADMTADGGGTNNTPMFDAARAALIAANKSWLHIPQQSAAYRFSTAPAVIHDGLLLTGERHYSNPGQVGVVTYVGIQVYRGTVLGFAPDVPGFKLVAYTDNASNALAFEYQSSTGTAIRDMILYSEGGTGTTSHGIETFVKTDLDNLRIVGFAGNGVKLSGDDSGTANQYGNQSTSYLRNVYSTSNKLHGFHVTGNNGSVIQFDDCESQTNGGVAFLDQGPFGNTYNNCLAATNNASFGTPAGYSAAQRTKVIADYASLATQINGSFVGYGGVQANTYNACYVEVGNGSYPDIGYQSVVNGGMLANFAWQYNVGTNQNPTISSGRGVDSNQFNFTKGPSAGSGVITTGNARLYRGDDRGLTLQGAPSVGGTYDITLVNKSDAIVAEVLTGTTTMRFRGTVQLFSANLFFNDVSTFPGFGGAGNAAAFATAAGGLNLAGRGSSYDVSLLNNAGTTALRIPVGTTNVEAVGTITGSNLSGTHSGTSSGTNTGDGAYAIQTKIAGYTATETSGDIIVKADLAAGFTIVLPTAVSNKARFTFKKIQSAGAIVIDGNASETIDGGLTATLNNQNESITICSDNANWIII